MVREIIIPTQNTYTITLPPEMLGKQVEVIAFEIAENKMKESAEDIRLKNLIENLNDCRVDLKKFKFNRDDANDYSRK